MIETQSCIWCSCHEKCVAVEKIQKKTRLWEFPPNSKKCKKGNQMKRKRLKLLLFKFNNFSPLTDIIDNIIEPSLSRDLNSHQWQCSIFVTRYRRRHVKKILHANGGSSGHLKLLSKISFKIKNWIYKIIIRAKHKYFRLLWDIVVFRLVGYLLIWSV